MTAEQHNFMDDVQSMGIVNALKTGNMHIDMIIAMCIPVILRLLFSFLSNLSCKHLMDKLREWFQTEYEDETVWYTRTIVHAEEKDRNQKKFSSIDDDLKNEILIKAITMYLQHLKCIKLQHADLKLTTMRQEYDCDYSDSDDEDDDEGGRFSNQLSSYKIVHNPPADEWHPTGRVFPSAKPTTHDPIKYDKSELHEVQIKINEKEESSGGDEGEGDEKKKSAASSRERRTAEYCLRSTGEESVDQFIEEAYAWYVSEIKRSEDKDKSRYYYDLKDEDYLEGQTHEYKRYKLSDDKSFNSLFFQERDTIVKLLDHFMSKTGKYSIEGYPYKLGLLLHGPPGTGKSAETRG